MAHYKEYRLIESTTQALEYYHIPKHNCFIPRGDNSQRVLLTLLSSKRDVHSPVHVSEYPIVTRAHSLLYPDTPKLTIMVSYQKYLSVEDIKHMESAKAHKKLRLLLDELDIDLDTL